MRLVIEEDASQVGSFSSEYVVERVTKWCEDHAETSEALFGLCLSGRGRVMSHLLDALVEAYKQGDFSFKQVAVFATDEFVGLPETHPATQHAYLWHKLFKHVDIKRENVYVLDGMKEDLVAECAAYEQAIERVGGIQLVVMESGNAGEVGRNESGSSLYAGTRLKTLSYDTLHDIAESQFDGDMSKVPKVTMTIGLKNLMKATEILLLFSGIRKSHALESCVETSINHMWPVSIFQKHNCCMIVCDEPATMELRVATVKYFTGLQQTAKLGDIEAEAHLTHNPSKRRIQKKASSQKLA
mmetsp:Transcript_9446/g.15444  ORF Transcript_9446/g.15444 Transcript_9446/m.15444 type:complete len:299 (-) Transcript_9446:49-945(-)|eukprot:CAMPEP_0203758534 /NCGR_PEP_ID=MMETSP0098-20131031/11380_1 /ASSEMBLY_ACC=CAM_ASM_000208 /TAXON_ID=96639 /ORGANISM=" , Strain NY0313808BC1" /LENGTH=298 /DNA_ID=CAMNT_0050651025 /DNA_START=49 /DNA_END=945 /DNA_ORIENTATION=-